MGLKIINPNRIYWLLLEKHSDLAEHRAVAQYGGMRALGGELEHVVEQHRPALDGAGDRLLLPPLHFRTPVYVLRYVGVVQDQPLRLGAGVRRRRG